MGLAGDDEDEKGLRRRKKQRDGDLVQKKGKVRLAMSRGSCEVQDGLSKGIWSSVEVRESLWHS